jgi:pimeloyl-ACP methyl ester carboxylesterase
VPRASVGNLEIEYDTFGDPSHPVVLLVMGLAYQMIEWDDAVCQLLAEKGFHVVRYDNRDAGLSTSFDELGTPDLLAVVTGTTPPPYTLDDMADDAVGLLDILGVEKAHVVGASMGGMIAQLVAINHPSRVLSLTSIMSTVGGPGVVQADPAVLEALLVTPGPSREERVQSSLEMRRLINGAGLPFDEESNRGKAERAIDRSYGPGGVLRQIAAIMAAPDRCPDLARLTIPTLVVHGEDDPLVPPENGRQTAAALPGSRLILFAAMGHNLPERLWPAVVDAVVVVTGRATAA